MRHTLSSVSEAIHVFLRLLVNLPLQAESGTVHLIVQVESEKTERLQAKSEVANLPLQIKSEKIKLLQA